MESAKKSALEAKNISKRFGEIKANDNISLTLLKGEILAVLGENGCGKTTLINILSGVYFPDKGSIYVNGRQVSFSCPADAYGCGIGVVHQHFTLVHNMTAFENILAGIRDKKFHNRKDAYNSIKETAIKYGFNPQLDKKVCNMSMSEKQTVEIMKLLIRGVDIFILDEPTTVLTPEETENLFNVIRAMKQNGKSVIIITHKLSEVLEISDRVFIMRKGRHIETILTADAQQNELAEKMVGHSLKLKITRPEVTDTSPRLIAKNLYCNDESGEKALSNVSFELFGGEILGVAGISGSGQKELCEALAGVCMIKSGDIILCNKTDNISIKNKNPAKREKQGINIGFVPEDRLGMGMISEGGITDNLMLREYRKNKGPFISKRSQSQKAERIIKQFNISTAGTRSPVRMMSGGNIQKVLLGREITNNPSVLIVSYPVRGLDIMTAYTVYDILNEQKKKGVAILFVSEELDVLMSLCDRIMVMSDHKISGIVDGKTATKEKIGLLMTESARGGNKWHHIKYHSHI